MILLVKQGRTEQSGVCGLRALRKSNPGGKLYFETIKIITQGIILFSINLYVLC